MKKHKKYRKKVGLPPGSLVYVGEQPENQKFQIELHSYNKDLYSKQSFPSAQEALKALHADDGYTWLNVVGLSDVNEVKKLGDFASIHNLFLEDVLDSNHRPKIEVFADSIFIIIKMLHYKEGKLMIEQVSFVLKENYLISFQEVENDLFHSICKSLNENDSLVRRKGTDYLLFSLMDAIVDHYFIILEELTEKVENFEDSIIKFPEEGMITTIQDLKREAMVIRRSIYPLREVISKLEKAEHPMIKRDTVPYFKDLYEHVIHVVEDLDVYRDMLLGLMDMYMSSMSNRMNNIMKILTIISTIFIPMTFVAGVYGMNFVNMDFLKNPYGYQITWGIMISLAVIMIVYYKKKKWL